MKAQATIPVEIIPFNQLYINDFKELNLAWIKRYFKVEPKDRELLENCKKSIVDKGGYVFFARLNEQIVGCFALIKVKDRFYELGKMAVDPQCQGLQIGQQLLRFAIDFAHSREWEHLVLYSHTSLHTALHIYRKYGFKEVTLEEDVVYDRSDIKMELPLNP